jgi:hypothetical protein
MSKLLTSPVRRGVALRNSVLGMAVATALALPQVAAAYEFDLGSESLSFRWDNTLRINVQDRLAGQNKDMIANPNYDDGDRNFNTGAVFERFDLYSEMDFVWKPSWGMLGARVSAAGWWDPGYASLDNESVQTENHLKNNVPALGLSDYSKRYGEGPSGEFMDWFLFSSFTVGDMPINMKAGQTTVYYGEALYAAANAIAYSQNPVDVWKSLNNPGAELKELYRPRVGFNVNSQVTDSLNVAAQYFFNWQNFSNQAWRYPESGTYLTLQDGLNWGGDSIIAGRNALYGAPQPPTALIPYCGLAPIPGASTCAPQQYTRLWRGKDITPDENSGNYGIALRWSPEWVDGTLGFYYRRTYDMQPQVMVTPDAVPAPNAAFCASVLHGVFVGGRCLQNSVSAYAPSPPYPVGTPAVLNQTGKDFLNYGRAGTYNTAYGSGIDIYGISLSKNIGGLSVGAELSYRTDMPLLSEPVTVLPAALRPYSAGGNPPPGMIWSDELPKNDTPGAKGDTMHALVNLVGVVGESIWDTASWATELSWMTYMNVTQNEAVFKGRGSAKPGKWTDYTWAIDAVDKNYFGLAINFTPTWFQVSPGMDLLTPISWSQGISGNSPISGGGQDGAGTFGVGLALDFYQRYRFDLKYIGFYGDYQKCKNVPGGNTSASVVGTCVGAGPNDVAVFNGTNATVADRDFISLTFKTSF